MLYHLLNWSRVNIPVVGHQRNTARTPIVLSLINFFYEWKNNMCTSISSCQTTGIFTIFFNDSKMVHFPQAFLRKQNEITIALLSNNHLLSLSRNNSNVWLWFQARVLTIVHNQTKNERYELKTFGRNEFAGYLVIFTTHTIYRISLTILRSFIPSMSRCLKWL